MYLSNSVAIPLKFKASYYRYVRHSFPNYRVFRHEEKNKGVSLYWTKNSHILLFTVSAFKLLELRLFTN